MLVEIPGKKVGILGGIGRISCMLVGIPGREAGMLDRIPYVLVEIPGDKVSIYPRCKLSYKRLSDAHK